MTFEAPGELLDEPRATPTLDEIQSFGVNRVRALVYWRDFAARPSSKRKPRFDTADPNAYPAGTWDRLDQLVASTQRRGMELQLTLTGPVPKWATKRKQRPASPTRARKLFGRWARAVATRYGDRVDLWSIWNEPNHPDFLGPQYKRRPAAHAEALPQALRRRRGRDPRRRPATRATRCCSARPRRSATRTSSRRSASCAGRCAWTRTTRSARAARSCGSTATRTTPTRAGPARRSSPTDPDEVSIGSLGRLTEALDKAAQRRRDRVKRAAST